MVIDFEWAKERLLAGKSMTSKTKKKWLKKMRKRKEKAMAQASRSDDRVWSCPCGCTTFYARQDGWLECTSCGEFQDEDYPDGAA